MLEEIDQLLDQARSRGAPICLDELERLYTDGCAEVLTLEADALRAQHRLKDLRDELRHVRTAIEFLREEQTKD